MCCPSSRHSSEYPDAREHERRNERRAGYVVAPAVRLSSPDLAPPDLTDQRVRDPVAPGKAHPRLVRPADRQDVIPGEPPVLSLDRLRGLEQDQHLSGLEERACRLPHAQEAIGIGQRILVDQPAPHRLLEHEPDRCEHLVDRAVRQGSATAHVIAASPGIGVGLGQRLADRCRLFDCLTLAQLAVDHLVRNTRVDLVEPA
jgi:hypothetical protein